MLRVPLRAFAIGLFVLPLQAQSINVDFGPADSPVGVPSPTYGASAGTPGVWNRISATSNSSLRAYDGTPTNVSLSTTSTSIGCTLGSGPFGWFDDPATSGEDERLLDDNFAPDQTSYTWVFEGLAPGEYTVDTILVGYWCIGAHFLVDVIGSPDPTQRVMADWKGFYLQGSTSFPTPPGSNFTRHTKLVTDGRIEVRVERTNDAYYQFLSGIQLNLGEQDYVGTNLCFGDGSVAACPCSNAGQTGIGCQNSAGTGGSWLFASGSPSPDTIVLHASGELPSALSIFFQGNVVVPPVIYGDGLRCAGGTIRRLYTKAASGGVVFAPGPGDPSITVQSANLGVPISPGGRRYYQVYYRDSNASFCPSPQGSTFNVSNAVKINW